MKLTYANKVAINENTDIPNINKVTDNDMNEIKAVVNNNDDDMITINTNLTNATTYSTDEIRVGTWMGKPLYRKSFYFTQWSGLGLDTYSKYIDNIINANVMLKNTATGQWMKLANNPDGSYGFYIKKTGDTYKIFISNDNVYTADAVCAFVEYTKTPD